MELSEDHLKEVVVGSDQGEREEKEKMSCRNDGRLGLTLERQGFVNHWKVWVLEGATASSVLNEYESVVLNLVEGRSMEIFDID